MAYLLDTNIFIEAQNRYYGFDFCPAFWDCLEDNISKGKIISIKQVYNEINGKDKEDNLNKWSEKINKKTRFFMSTYDKETQKEFSKISQHVMNSNYSQKEKDVFLGGADPWLIAKAKVLEATVVTQERKAGLNSKKIKIPNICSDFGVKFIDTFEMLRRLNAKFTYQQE